MAEHELFISKPYFEILGRKNITKNLRTLLIKQAPVEFYSILTNTVRHILNGTFCSKNSNFCNKHKNSLYLLALPSTSVRDKHKILFVEEYTFIAQIYEALLEALKA